MSVSKPHIKRQRNVGTFNTLLTPFQHVINIINTYAQNNYGSY